MLTMRVLNDYYTHFSEKRKRVFKRSFIEQFAEWGLSGSRYSHSRRGVLSMANGGYRHSQNSQFFITFGAATHLDRKHVVFGQARAARRWRWLVFKCIQMYFDVVLCILNRLCILNLNFDIILMYF